MAVDHPSEQISRHRLSVDLLRAAARSETFPKDWTPDRTEQAADDYVRFLLLVRRYPEAPIAPTADIDAMWHLHMLHPVAYAADCERLVGFVLDHDGGFGATEAEQPILAETFARTAALWEAAYGVPYIGRGSGMTKCQRNCVSRCWHACKTKREAAPAALSG